MKLKKGILTVLLQALIYTLMGQDMQFTQFYASPVYLNPSFTGANACAQLSLMHRNQWRGISKPIKSYLLAFDHNFHQQRIGLGFVMAEDYAGTGGLKTTLIRPSIAYGANLNKYYVLRFGIQPGFGIKRVDYSNLLFGDQIYRGGSSVPTVEPPVNPKTYFDLCAGVLIANKNFWGGISVYHLNEPDESLNGTMPAIIPVYYSFHAGTKIEFNPGEHDLRQRRSLTPVVHYRGQRKFDQLDIGFYFTKYVFNVGFWYRGLPWLKAYKHGYQNNDAISFIVGIQNERVKTGYSYDLTISEMTGITKGSHEITLSFQLCNPKKRRIRHALISCPKF